MKYKLKELTQIQYGKDHKKLKDGNIPVFGTGGLMRYGDNYLFEGDSVLIPRKGSLNNLQFITGKFWTVDTLFWTKIDVEKVIPKYLFYVLKRFDFAQMNVGSAVPSLTTALLNELEVEIPDINLQQSILDKINPFESQITNLSEINDNLRDLLQEKFKKIISETPAELTTLQNLSPSIIAGDWGKDIPDEVNNSSVMVIRGADIPSISAGGKGQSPERYIKQAARIKKELKSSDVIVEISGGSPTQSTGRNLFISNDLLKRFPESVIGTNFTKVLRFSSYNQAVFAYFYLQYFYNAGLFFNYENGTTGIKNLDYKSVLKIPIRNVLESDSFVEFVQLFSIIERMRQTNGVTIETLTQARDTLLAKLIN